MTCPLDERIRGTIFTVDYPIRFGGMDLYSRMTIVKLNDDKLWLHSPCKPDPRLKPQIDDIGEVTYMVAPGNFHHRHVADIQAENPDAETFLCPGLERKRADLEFDWILGNRPDRRWEPDFDQVLVQGTRFINEVVLFHRSTNTNWDGVTRPSSKKRWRKYFPVISNASFLRTATFLTQTQRKSRPGHGSPYVAPRDADDEKRHILPGAGLALHT